MSRVLIDTNAYTALMTGDGRIAEELARSEAVLLLPVVLGELYDGFKGGAAGEL
jgi:tRNA(fMet)-specific endonuclease VapC